ncbi:MAG: chemotaxis protein CheW [Candidatus Goldbacteria bacterium]|nr:chemotaxis protein CheW [Candidatus Goldiibacteriota bacterium]
MEKKIVGFRLKGEEFAFNIMKVVEIIRLKQITPVPTAPSFIEGVINLRGKIIPIIDLRKRFKLHEDARGKNVRIIIIEMHGSQLVGVIVDEVTQVITVPEEQILPAPPSIVSVGGRYIEAVVQLEDKIIVFLDIEKIFSDQENSEMQGISITEAGIEESPDC